MANRAKVSEESQQTDLQSGGQQTRQGNQQSTQGAGQTAGTVTSGSVRDDDIGEAERFKVQNADNANSQFNFVRQVEQTALAHLQAVNSISENILANLAVAANRTNQNAVTADDRTKSQELRHADIAIENQWHENPRE